MRKMLRLAFLALLLPALSGCIAVFAVAGAGAGAAHDRRGVRTVFDDKNLQLSALDVYNKDKELALQNDVSIVVYNGVMLLVGEVRTAELKARAERLVSGFSATRKLVNEIEVREPEGFWSRRRDNTITVHAKTAMLDIVDQTGFDPTRINITTTHRVVYLMGIVSRDEAERIVEIARNVAGVERVVKVFEYED